MKKAIDSALDITNEVNDYRDRRFPDKVDMGGKEYQINNPSQVLVFDDNGKMDEFLVGEFEKGLIDFPDKGLTLPTGNTYNIFYQSIVSDRDKFSPLFRKATHSILDELYPLHPEDLNWFSSFVMVTRLNLIDRLGLDIGQWIMPNSRASDPKAETYRFNSELKQNKWGLCMLGIGPDARGPIPASPHIAFIPKGTTPDMQAMHVKLDKGTMYANRKSAYDPESYPIEAITQGLDNLADSQRHILVAKGVRKSRNILKTLLQKPIAEVPASLLNIISNDFTVVLDCDSAGVVMNKVGI